MAAQQNSPAGGAAVLGVATSSEQVLALQSWSERPRLGFSSHCRASGALSECPSVAGAATAMLGVGGGEAPGLGTGRKRKKGGELAGRPALPPCAHTRAPQWLPEEGS